jgi:hypothetical protein
MAHFDALHAPQDSGRERDTTGMAMIACGNRYEGIKG